MRIKPPRRNRAEQRFLVIQQNRAGCVLFRRNAIDQNHALPSSNPMGEIQRRGTQIGDFDVLAELVLGLKQPDHIRTQSVIPEQYIAHAANQYAAHRILAVEIFRPEGSNAWHAHAMHGSNECTVLRTSSGSSGLASGVCNSEASYGPCAPE